MLFNNSCRLLAGEEKNSHQYSLKRLFVAKL